MLLDQSLVEPRQLVIGVVHDVPTSSQIPFLTQVVISNWLVAITLTPQTF